MTTPDQRAALAQELERVILWALGEVGEFPDWPATVTIKGNPKYWWRTELRKRYEAALRSTAAAPEANPQTSDARDGAKLLRIERQVRLARRFHFAHNPPNTGVAQSFNDILAAIGGPDAPEGDTARIAAIDAAIAASGGAQT